ncbi:FAD/NAD-binding domain-containing protein [Mycena galericulata]|nr:FAD/NAD-binding domain-containing protein [Mycena galericulata]
MPPSLKIACPLKVAVVGAGPVGCLSAIALAKLGWEVTIYERRPDPRTSSLLTGDTGENHGRQRSINLTLSSRGIAAIQALDPRIVERLLSNAVPLRGRMVHHLGGKTQNQQYDRSGQCLYSIERGLLNAILLDEASSMNNIRTIFSQKVQSVDFDSNTLYVQDAAASGQEFKADFDLCIGADGSHSVIRRCLMQATQMDYNQHYLSHEYVEIKIPPGVDSSGCPAFLLDPDHLHVWPRGNFTIVAMPNKNKSFTCALFAPRSLFDNFQNPATLVPWFKENFPDVLSLLGEKRLLLEFQQNPRSQLVTTKANPYHKDSVIILGDSAHSMVPFYGQGLNCALEDVRILSILLRREHESAAASVDFSAFAISRVLDQYSAMRHKDLVAICDLAMESHLKMRHSVATWSYNIRWFMDNVLYALTASIPTDISALNHNIYGPKPSGWIPLYTMVSFRADISYSEARKKAQLQDRIINGVGICLALLFIAFLKLFCL